MRYSRYYEDSFYNCSDVVDKTGGFFMPFCLVDSTNPSDNKLYFQFYTQNDVTLDSVQLHDYETVTAVLGQPPITIRGGTITVDGQILRTYLIEVDMKNVTTACFFFVFFLGKGKAIKTEAFKLYNFSDCPSDFVRLESDYPNYDCLLHDLEIDDTLPIEYVPNHYFNFVGGAKFVNRIWVHGSMSFYESKFTKSYEGFFNTHTKTGITEEYKLFTRHMPDWYAKELSNILGGSNLKIWNGQRETRHKTFDCTELTLTKDEKTCVVLPSNIRLKSVQKSIIIGCSPVTTLDELHSVECLAFLTAGIGTFTKNYTSGFGDLIVSHALPYTPNFEIYFYAVASFDPTNKIEEHTVMFNNAQNFTLDFSVIMGLANSADGLIWRSDQIPYSGVNDFDVTWFFEIRFTKAPSCSPQSNYGFARRFYQFKTVMHYIFDNQGFFIPQPYFIDGDEGVAP